MELLEQAVLVVSAAPVAKVAPAALVARTAAMEITGIPVRPEIPVILGFSMGSNGASSNALISYMLPHVSEKLINLM